MKKRLGYFIFAFNFRREKFLPGRVIVEVWPLFPQMKSEIIATRAMKERSIITIFFVDARNDLVGKQTWRSSKQSALSVHAQTTMTGGDVYPGCIFKMAATFCFLSESPLIIMLHENTGALLTLSTDFRFCFFLENFVGATSFISFSLSLQLCHPTKPTMTPMSMDVNHCAAGWAISSCGTIPRHLHGPLDSSW